MATKLTLPKDIADTLEDQQRFRDLMERDGVTIRTIHKNFREFLFQDYNSFKEFWQMLIALLEELWVG